MVSSTEFLDRAYALKSTSEAQTFYDEWAQNYDTDMDEFGYRLPSIVAGAIPKHANVTDRILDAGCGTGLVGLELSRLGAKTVDGWDISPGMLARAAKLGVYKDLEVVDLTKRFDVADGSYDSLVCSGTLTHGHVGPEALQEFVRVVKSGGVIAVSIIDDLWEDKGYKAQVEHLEKDKTAVLIENEKVEFRTQRNVYVRLIVLRKL